VFAAFVEGWRRALGAKALAVSVLVAMFLVSVPLAMAPGDLVGRDVAGSLMQAVNRSRSAWATELGVRWLTPGGFALREILGFASTIAVAYILFWVFVSGGILDRLARARRVGTAQFFASCGVYLLRFIRLGMIVAATYWVLFRVFRPQITDTRQFAAFLAALALVNLIVDYAKVRTVVEDRRSVLGALLAALRFVRVRPVRAVGLYALNVLIGIGIGLLWQRGVTAGMPVDGSWLAFGIGQAFLLIRIVARLAFLASEIVFFQRELAHVAYTAAPEIVWPDSPAVEAIRNLAQKTTSEVDSRRT